MEAYHYEALNAAGRSVSGVLQADTPRHARALLRAQGLLPSTIDKIHVRDKARQLWARGLSASELSMVTRQMATLLASGLTVEHAINALTDEAENPRTKEILTGVKAEVSAGLTFAGALGSYEKSFPEFYRALVRGGEDSGALPTVLQHLSDYLDARQALKQKTALALLYPALVSIVAVLIVSGLLVYVVPQVVQVFQQSRQHLPVLTRALIGLSDFLRSAWPYLLLGVIAAATAIHFALRNHSIKRSWHAFALTLPFVGPLIRGINTSRFASTLAILVGGGIPLLSALASSSKVLTNLVMRDAVESALDRLRGGAPLSKSLSATRAFPAMLTHLIASGEVSGKLEQMLDRAAKLETQTLERRLSVFLTVLEPMMILMMGGIVLLIVLAILLPIIEINQLVR
jgi:general secretion pathway protein F